jgi:P27 family predicted phage terminase small subunit
MSERKPHRLKVLEGRSEKERLHVPIRSSIGAPKAPAHLSAAARQEWKRIVPRLERAGLLDELDLDVLVAYVELVVVRRQAQAVIDEKGLTFKASNGDVRVRPELKIVNDATTQLLQVSRRLGLDPRSRESLAGVGLGTAKDQDEDDKAVQAWLVGEGPQPPPEVIKRREARAERERADAQARIARRPLTSEVDK